ncbi:MAG TPA: oxygenase MpaB family protein [Candidatus Binatia bacterium]|nr:oxygenase MpaB family protein [Candidatus Binatia bacterium]
MSRLPGVADLAARATAVPLVRIQPMPLRDRSPDPGIFGPGSVTWKVLREPILVLGGGRALLLQVANPLVAQGAIDHSSYRTDPYGRLLRTLEWVAVCSFGTTIEARAICRSVNRLHGSVRGRLPRRHATAEHRPRRAYSARDQSLLTWVHASFVDTMLVTHDALVGGLADRDRDRFVREWNTVAALMGVPEGGRWSSRADLAGYIAAEISSGRVTPGRGSRAVAETVLAPPLPSILARPAWRLLAFTTVGLLPDQLRRDYGIFWTPAHDAAHHGLCAGMRAVHASLPRRLRVSPTHDWAARRVGAPAAAQRRRAA